MNEAGTEMHFSPKQKERLCAELVRLQRVARSYQEICENRKGSVILVEETGQEGQISELDIFMAEFQIYNCFEI